MRLPILNDVTFVIKKVKLASDKEIERRGWVVGILILLIGVIGFIIHLIMSLFWGMKMFYAIRVATRQEKIVALMIKEKAKKNMLPIYSVVFNDVIKGYIFVESEDDKAVLEVIKGIKHVKGIVQKPLQDEEVLRMLKVEEKVEEEIKIGDIIEIISGPFKGEKAKVIGIDKSKNEYTVLPLEALVQIPLRIKGKSLKLSKVT